MSTPDALTAMAEEIRELRRRLDAPEKSEQPLLDYGTYLPTITNGANVAASTAYTLGYFRVGNAVHVYGAVDIDPTSAGTPATFSFSLPIASNFAAPENAGGTLVHGSLSNGNAGQILADATNDLIECIVDPAGSGNIHYTLTFTYRVI